MFQETLKCTHRGECAAPVHPKDAVDQLVVQGVQIAMRNETRNTSAVDQHITTALSLSYLGSQCVERRAVVDIELTRPMSGSGHPAQQALRRILRVAKRDHYSGARLRAVSRNR